MRNHMRITLTAVALCVLALGACNSQRHYDSPEAAVAALTKAADARDHSEIRRIFGPDAAELRSGDDDQDKLDAASFRRSLSEAAVVERQGDDDATLLIGEVRWPFAVPLVRGEDGTWRFDTDAGIDELENRRIGRNELWTIEALLTLTAAQNEYIAIDRDSDGAREYAARLLSSPGARDGLYWDSPGGVDPSPIGPVLAAAAQRRDEKGNHVPYHGYRYRLLTSQGAGAPGGAMNYESSSGLTAGWAAIAWPDEYDGTGVMSFMVSSNGVVYQKDLGLDTESAAAAITDFDPSTGWTPVSN